MISNRGRRLRPLPTSQALKKTAVNCERIERILCLEGPQHHDSFQCSSLLKTSLLCELKYLQQENCKSKITVILEHSICDVTQTFLCCSPSQVHCTSWFLSTSSRVLGKISLSSPCLPRCQNPVLRLSLAVRLHGGNDTGDTPLWLMNTDFQPSDHTCGLLWTLFNRLLSFLC